MVDLITSALQAAALQRSSAPGSEAKPASSSVLNLASDSLTSNTRSAEASGLIFGPSAGFFNSNEAFLTVARAGNNSNSAANTFTANAFSSNSSSAAQIQLNELLSSNNTSIDNSQVSEPITLPEANAENLITVTGDAVLASETNTLIESDFSSRTEVENITSSAIEPIIDNQVQNITNIEPSSSPGNIRAENENGLGDQD